MVLHEWLAFYSAFLNIHRSGVLTALAWLVPHETAAVSAQVLCTPYNHAPCHFMHSHIRKVYACLAVTCHLHLAEWPGSFTCYCGNTGVLLLLSWCLMSSDVIWHIRDKLWPMPKHGSIRKVYACLAVTCHLHFWQNDRDFLRATVVTRGWNGYRNKIQHRKSTLEKKILPPFQQGFEPATLQSRVRRSNHWAIPAPCSRERRIALYKRPSITVCGFYWTVLRHWSQLVPNMSNDIWGH